MPELPEVETIRRDLQRVVRGKQINRVHVRMPKLVRLPDGRRAKRGAALSRHLRGRTIVGIRRRGKLLIFDLDRDDRFLLIHLKMTGQLIYCDDARTVAGGHNWPPVEKLPNAYTHATFFLNDGAKLFYNDLRQFGYLQVVDADGLAAALAPFGPEPLASTFTVDYLRDVLRGRQTALKNVLLNQSLVAGLGNIYVDEACFRSGVRPTRRASRVTAIEVGQLHHSIRTVLRQALKERGTTFGSYRDGLGSAGNFVRLLRVYGRAGQRCKKCRQAEVVKTKIGGRGTA